MRTAGRQVIAIDCDDVLINASRFIVDAYNKRYGTSVQLAHAHMSKNPEWLADRDEVFRRLYEIQHTKEFGEIIPRHDAMEVIPRLAKAYDLHLITARSDEVLLVTERMIAEYFAGCFVGIDHVGPDSSKGAVCERIGASIMVDDNIRHLEAALHHGVKAVVWFGDYDWQTAQLERASKLPIIHCNDWYEVETRIGQLTN